MYDMCHIILLQVLESLGTPHIESFNHMLKDGLRMVLENMDPEEFEISNNRIGIKLQVCIFYYQNNNNTYYI
jgi:hypothetical protein